MLFRSPNGLWFGGVSSISNGWSCSVAIDDVNCAFDTQQEVLEYCYLKAIRGLQSKSINEDPEEIEERCPDCTAWAEKHIEITIEEGGTPEMWSGQKHYQSISDYKLVGVSGEVGTCPTCDYERPEAPWFGGKKWSMDEHDNTITRMETDEEVSKRVEEERNTPKYGKLQPEADKLVAKLESLLNASKPAPSPQLELAFA